jgi:hypothetical protein
MKGLQHILASNFLVAGLIKIDYIGLTGLNEREPYNGRSQTLSGAKAQYNVA